MKDGKADKRKTRGRQKTNPPKWTDPSNELDPRNKGAWAADCPAKYEIVIAYLCGEIDGAYFGGKYNALLSNQTIIEAVEILADPLSAGTGAAAVAEMAADVAEAAAQWRKTIGLLLADGRDAGGFLQGVFAYDPRGFISDEAAAMRRFFLRREIAPQVLRALLKLKAADAAMIAEFLKPLAPDEEDLKNPVRVRADWLNEKFSYFADCHIMRWLDFVELPHTFAADKIRAEIADSFGLFPLPFSVSRDRNGREYVAASPCLLSLLRLLKAEAAKIGAGRKDGMTQKKFAERCGVSVRTVQNWDEGKTSPPCGLKYTPRIYERDALSAYVFAGLVMQTKGRKVIYDSKIAELIADRLAREVWESGQR